MPILILTLTFASCKEEQMKQEPKAPVAEKQLVELKEHGGTRIDNYFWMRLSDEQKLAEQKDEQTKKVYDYLEAENAYYDKMTENTKEFQETLFQEMIG